jgi:hypothetical protein
MTDQESIYLAEGGMSATHWLTRYDDDGDPYGTTCWCDIAADHFLNGTLTFPRGGNSEPGVSA